LQGGSAWMMTWRLRLSVSRDTDAPGPWPTADAWSAFVKSRTGGPAQAGGLPHLLFSVVLRLR
jgi:hypothetical protein